MSEDEFLYGEEYAEKIKSLENDLLKVEERHIDWFKNRQSEIPNQEHDRLHNHYTIYYDGSGIYFNFQTEDVPDEIQQQCLESFGKHFPSE